MDIYDRIRENIFYRSQEAIDDYASFKWHNFKKEPDSYKTQSSQALAIDVFGCLKLSPIKKLLINSFFNENNTEEWEIKYEYTNPGLLNEAASTQIDVLIENKQTAYFVECKFTEAGGGSCSQIQKQKSADNLPQCNGNYEKQANPLSNIESKCALTGKGIKYWDYITQIFDYSSENEYRPCPFKGEEYQWMRNLCFAKAYSIQENKKCEFIVFYLESNISKFSQKIKKKEPFGNISANIKENPPVCHSYVQFIKHCIAYCKDNNYDEEKEVWSELFEWLNKKK